MTLVLDAGALIAVERADRPTLTVLEAARRQGRGLVVPAGVIAQDLELLDPDIAVLDC